MSATEIEARLIDAYRDGRWKLMAATAPGMIHAMTKAGIAPVPFAPGDLLIADRHDGVVIPPIGPTGALDLAERVMDGDPRATTDPLAIYVLAAALCGLVAQPPTETAAAAVEGDAT